MPTGEVAFFDSEAGYGFVETDAADEDVFVHRSAVEGEDPTAGERVAFDLEQTADGPRARNLTRT
ncbi:MAG: cold-shock protein [Halobacteriaceae archaeon]